MTKHDPHAGPGRPRSFDADRAVDAGIDLFRRQGFEATSLEGLTEAMGISRSSFYAAFGSKHGVLLAALERYSRQRLATLEDLAAQSDGVAPLLSAIAGLADSHGCLMVNCIAELSPRDPEVAALTARHLDRVAEILASRLPDPATAAPRGRALLALALGAQTLHKSGAPPGSTEAVLALAAPLISPPA
ncbi:MAG: TetR/AcrR family transcriptional regulator [Amaricoccus sp.]